QERSLLRAPSAGFASAAKTSSRSTSASTPRNVPTPAPNRAAHTAVTRRRISGSTCARTLARGPTGELRRGSRNRDKCGQINSTSPNFYLAQKTLAPFNGRGFRA
ncbi:UNVERIFIED_CONTAM: hypothetical protein GTU68_019485, partial [Idotea baltica]|nr:hypothetical protein [Idotea baltica]